MKNIVIAIDGTAGSGKSTTARLVAQRLGYLYLDTGAMYRALGLKCLKEGVDLDDESGVAAVAESVRIELAWDGTRIKVAMDGIDVTGEIRMQEVSDASSRVAVFPRVRAAMVAKQRRLGAGGGVVAEGRDTTTAVFPDAELKIYMDADLSVRAERRLRDEATAGAGGDLRRVEEDLRKRDGRDAGRKASPLSVASDAELIDTSSMTIEEQVGAVIRKAEEILEGGAQR